MSSSRPPRRWAGFTAAVGLTGSLFLGAPAASAAPTATEDGRPSAVPLTQVRPDPDTSRVCRGLVPYPIPPAYRSYYLCGDWRLGPRRLPTQGPVGTILRGYNRLGGLTAVQFLNRWWLPSADSGQGDWDYPPDDGFAHDSQGRPLGAPLLLHASDRLILDRFGNESGRFMSPAGTKFGQRAIPPSNLNTSDPRYPYNYHLYRLAKDLTVCAGPAAPAFEQPGGAIQYATASSSVCPTIPFTTVANLVSNGTLVRAAVPTDQPKSLQRQPLLHTPAR
ncbi:TNT domain-containing protein [Streptomyces sp. NPDC047000]|uniref:TNT domain-containing protein n=1 Tax=Streptomyces sp. NPDC047000 TaxID=3155474 RepID=UPI0033C50669